MIQQRAGHPSYFNLFDIHVSLPAILELEEDQITYLLNTGSYNVKELNASQTEQAKPTPLSAIEGDRFDRARTLSVNELAFKTPILGTKFAKKAKDALVVSKNSSIGKMARKNSTNTINNSSSISNNSSIKLHSSNTNTNNQVNKKPTINTKIEDKTSKNKDVENSKPVQPSMLENNK